MVFDSQPTRIRALKNIYNYYSILDFENTLNNVLFAKKTFVYDSFRARVKLLDELIIKKLKIVEVSNVNI